MTTLKKIHILLSKKSFEELRDLERNIDPNQVYGPYHLPDTYEKYLKNEEKNPTMALFG